MTSVVVLSLLCGCSKSVSDAYRDSENAQRDAAEAWVASAAAIEKVVVAREQSVIQKVEEAYEKFNSLPLEPNPELEEGLGKEQAREMQMGMRRMALEAEARKMGNAASQPRRYTAKAIELFLAAAAAAAAAAADPTCRTAADLAATNASDHIDAFVKEHGDILDAEAIKASKLAKEAAEAARMARN